MEKILVVIDMQNDFINGALGTKEAESIVPQVEAKIKQYQQEGAKIYFTKDTHAEDYLQTQEGKNLPVEHCIKGTMGWELHPSIGLLATEVGTEEGIFEKNVFGSKQLAETIRATIADEKEVVIELVGLCTDICVIANAMVLKTYMSEAKIQVDAACCAGVTPESHSNALDAMAMCQITVINR